MADKQQQVAGGPPRITQQSAQQQPSGGSNHAHSSHSHQQQQHHVRHRGASSGGVTRASSFAVTGSTPFKESNRGWWRRCVDRVAPANKTAVSLSVEMLLLSAVVYGVLVFAAGKAFLPGGAAFAALVIWICSVTGAHIAHWLRIPRVVGMLGAGLLLANVPGSVIAAFPPKWGVQMRAAALATIFLRCGLELEFKTMALYKWPALRLAFLPGVIEALFDAGVAVAVFGMPFTLALSLGFILKAVGPGLVVPAMFDLQKQGLGSAKGIPPTVVIAASFDDIIAITGFSIFINVAIATGESAAWQIASGPLQVIFGMLGGMLAGAVLGATRLFDNRYKRLIGIYGSALLIMFFLEFYDMLSGGALGSLTVGMVTCLMWEHGRPRRLSHGPSQAYSADVERVMAKVWNWLMEPMLFATIGTSIVFKNLPPQTVPKSLLVVCTGLAVRIIATFLVMGGPRYNWKERLFYALAWTPKATVQASLSAVPLSLITRVMVDSPDYAQWVQWGEDMLATGIFAIIVCASLGTLAVHWLAPVLLEREERAEDARAMQRVSRDATRSLIQRQMSMSRADTHALQTLPSGEALTADMLLQEMRLVDDHTLINEYFDAIERLVDLVMQGRGMQAQQEGLCTTLLHLQEAIAQDVGPRQMTVRQMLHSAALRSRQPSITAAAADQLVRLSATDLPGSESAVNGLAASLKGGSAPGSLAGGSPRAPHDASAHSALDTDDVEHGRRRHATHAAALESVGSTLGGIAAAAAAAAARAPTAASSTAAAAGGAQPPAGAPGSQPPQQQQPPPQ